MKKGITAIMMIFVMSILLTGCSVLMEDKTESNGITVYPLDTSIEELPDGLLLKTSEHFTSCYTQSRTYSGVPDPNKYAAEKNSRLVWYNLTNNQMGNVPVYDESTSVIYKSTKTIPDSFCLEAFEHLCDSLGIRGIQANPAGKFYISSDKYLHSGSSAYTALSPYLDSGTIVLETINGVNIEPAMINKAGSFTGLTKGKAYRLGFYIGTRYYEADMLADTEIYASKKYYAITGYETTKKGYIVLTMPDLLEPGLYDLNGNGIFWYAGVSIAEQLDVDMPVIDGAESTDNTSETLPVQDIKTTIEAEPETEETTIAEPVEGESEEGESASEAEEESVEVVGREQIEYLEGKD